MKKGFTLIELMVAVGLFAMVIAFSAVIFNASIKAQRVATANAEIMQNLRVITDQLNRDFRGFRKDANHPMAISFECSGPDSNDIRADRIAFLADGDFQSTRQYGSPSKTIVGNVASIFYGQATEPNVFSVKLEDKRKKILARRQTILTSDPNTSLKSDSNPYGEYYLMSPAEWDVNSPFYPKPFDSDEFVERWTRRPGINPIVPDDPNLVMYMARGVDDFTVQAEDYSSGILQWWPKNNEVIGKTGYPGGGMPRAVKFTFTLYDSKGIIREGMRFSHIVYIGD